MTFKASIEEKHHFYAKMTFLLKNKFLTVVINGKSSHRKEMFTVFCKLKHTLSREYPKILISSGLCRASCAFGQHSNFKDILRIRDTALILSRGVNTRKLHMPLCRIKENTSWSEYKRHHTYLNTLYRSYSTEASPKAQESHDYLDCSDSETKSIMCKHMQVIYDFISDEEEQQLFNEVEPYLKRLRYESSHWDDAIHQYRETERKSWREHNKKIIQRIRDIAFPPGTAQLAYVHVLDLKKEGYIKPHVDAVKFCGSTIAGISLLSPAVMRLVHTEDKTKVADILLERRSLYIMKDAARYSYTHEVLPQEKSVFKGKTITKDRRISIICRNEPK